ncbi:MAG: hypothetical protein M3322_03290 [Actinomycetota bacterium]|nr:hypothetical protein [Actinomycetota bacterium]
MNVYIAERELPDDLGDVSKGRIFAARRTSSRFGYAVGHVRFFVKNST